MNAEGLMAALEADPAARLRWRVLRTLGVCPLSLRGRLLTRRRAIGIACQLVLDARSAPAARAETEHRNPGFDMARFRALAAR